MDRTDPRQLIMALEHTLRGNPDNVEVMLRLARLYQAMGMPFRAERLIERARRRAPNHPGLRNQAAPGCGGRASEGLLEQLRALVHRLFRRNPTRPSVGSRGPA